ncbi:transcriptional regulator [Oleiphilus sp. HI0081]|nr:transcriptional regulator [Oleiphilus sp. HI0072]KZZ11207.1 transcriptional regulator [Oleiphilus sp. HI0078]KZZ19796.1 transcriptional regulator [Oleiphilus sp. HI0081]
MTIQSPFPKRLKEARNAAGLSQKQLGIRAGLDEFTASPRMNQYEKGTHAPEFSLVKSIAKVLNVPTAYFYAEEDELAELIEKFQKPRH